ncbi:MAG TPA: DMT family transporter [Gaiellaceae bacterium]|nr:DMT family transporter [Gaiellaceae bacterium]
MLAVAFAALSGALFGALAVAVRAALRRGGDPELGAVAVPGVGLALALAISVPSLAVDEVHVSDLWPFALAGLLVPGASQLLFIAAVRDAGPSRTAILIGTAPLMSVAIALVALGEPLRPLLLVATALVVAGGFALARERARPEHFRLLGAVLALACAALFAVRDNVVRSAARGAHPPPLVAADVSLAAAFAFTLGYVLLVRPDRLRGGRRASLAAFAPAGVMLALAYDLLFAAFDRGRVSVVAPLNATQSLWAVLVSAAVYGRQAELIGRRLVAAGLLVVAGAAVVGVVR